MVRIAIVDDNHEVCIQIEKQLYELAQELMFRCSIDVFYDGESLCIELGQKKKYDIIFLDIELAQLNGVGVGKYIREQLEDQWSQIIFISARKDYAMELFNIRPMDFLVKPIEKTELRRNLLVFLKIFPESDVFSWKNGKETRQIAYSSILYFSSDDKEVFVCTEHEMVSFYGKLSDVEQNLPAYFWRIHRSHLINQHYISHHQIDSVRMKNGVILPISKQYRSLTRTKLMELHTTGGEELFT